MSDVPIQIIVAAFKDENSATGVLNELKQAKKEKLIGIQNAAVLRKDADGKLRIKETADMGGGKGAAIGGVLGGVLGLIAGPVGWAALGGAVIGGLAAKLRDSGFSDARLKQIGEGLKPGSSAIIAVIEHKWVRDVEKMMAEAGADVVTESLKRDIAEQLEAGNELAYSATLAGDAVGVTRIAAGEDEVQVGNLISTDEGTYVEGARVTKDEIAAGAAMITDEGAAAIAASAKLAGEAETPADQPAGDSSETKSESAGS